MKILQKIGQKWETSGTPRASYCFFSSKSGQGLKERQGKYWIATSWHLAFRCWPLAGLK